MSDQSMLDQLKNDGNDDRFIPGVVSTSTPVNDGPEFEGSNRVDMGEVVVSKAAKSVQRKTAPMYLSSRAANRQPVDIGTIVQEGMKNNGEVVQQASSPQESIINKVFAPGGDFDQHIERRKKEMEETMSDPEFIKQAEEALRQQQNSDENAEIDSLEDNYDDFYDEIDSDNEVSTTEEIDTSSAAKIDFEEDPEVEVEDDVASEDVDEVDENITSENNEETINESVKVSLEDGEMEIKTDTTEAEIVTVDDIENDNDEEEDDDDTRIEYLKEEITKKLNPVSKKLDISGFTVVKRGTKPAKTEAIFREKPARMAKWPLPNTGIVICMKEIPGATLEMIRTNTQRNDANSVLRTVYDYVVSAKPQNFEAWAKSIDAEDYDHMFMAIYIACFQGANYMPIDCPNTKCKRRASITDNLKFIDMVKFGDTKIKEDFLRLNKEEPVNPTGDRVAYRVPISEYIAVDLVRPTLYSEFIEIGYLPENFIKQHESTINLIRYIDKMYTIDADTQQLTEVWYDDNNTNPGRSVANKVRAYSKCIKSMSVDEIGVLNAYVNKLSEKTVDITYQRPEVKCAHCGTTIPAMEMSAPQMVFLRNQLGLLTII